MKDIILSKDSNQIEEANRVPKTVGEIANALAAHGAFSEYRSVKADMTIRRQNSDLELFSEYLRSKGLNIKPSALIGPSNDWRHVTWGLVNGFSRWQQTEGYSVQSINVRLSTVRVYVKLAIMAGLVSESEAIKISQVKGLSRSDGLHIDAKRKKLGLETRRKTKARTVAADGGEVISTKKEKSISIKPEWVMALKDQPDIPQGRRDYLLICLLLDHGLRVGEVAILTVENFDINRGEIEFFRPKVNKVQTHRMTDDTHRAASAYLTKDAPRHGIIWRGSYKDGKLKNTGMTTRALNDRVRVLGETIGLDGLSPHDCRHYWTTQALKNGSPIESVMQAGGWNSIATLLRYLEENKIANEGVKL